MAITNSDGSIILSTKVDTSGLNKGMSQMEKHAAGLTKAFSKLGAVIASAFAIQKIIQFSNQSASLATQTEASVQRLVDIYGSASDSVGDFIDANARALGMSKAAAASFSSVYGNLFSVWADQATNAELTNRYLNMTAVVASKTGRTVEDVQERVRSGLLGNTEAIEDLGIFVNVKTIEMTDAFQRMANGKSWEQLDAYTQQQIRSMAILEQATSKYGTQVATTTATTRARYQAAYEDFKNSWGNIVNVVLIPILEALTKIFNTATAILNVLSGRSGKIVADTEIIADNSKQTAQNIEEQTKSQKEFNKELKKTVAGFDDLQILTSNSQDGGIRDIDYIGGASIELVGDLGMANADADMLALESKIADWVQRIENILSPIGGKMKEIWNNIVPSREYVKQAFEWVKDNVFVPFGQYIVNNFIPANLETLNKAFILIGDAVEAFGDDVIVLWDEALKPIFKDIGSWALEIIEQVGNSFGYISEKLFEYEEEISSVINGISTIIQLAWSILSPLADAFVKSIGDVFQTTIDFIFAIVQALGGLFDSVKFIFKAIVSLLKGNFDEAKEYAKEALESFVNMFIGIANTIISVINNLWVSIFQSVRGAVNAIAGFINKIGDFAGIELDLNWNATPPTIPLIPKYVPKLARGAVIPPNKEFLAVLGDQKQGTNIEAPADLIKQMVKEAMGEYSGNANTTREEHYYLNETELMSIVYRLFKGGERLNGENLVSGGVY